VNATTCQQVSSSPWANAAVVATFLGALAFVVTYAWSTRGAWRDSPVGLNVMTLMAVILAVSSLAVAAIIWGNDWPYRDAIRTVAWSAIAGCIWWRLAILWRVQHRRP
jgi:hypothetical protein